MASMAALSFGVLQPWAYGIARSQLDHLGKMRSRRGSSDRSDESALTTLLSSASGIFVIYSARTNNIITKPERTCR